MALRYLFIVLLLSGDAFSSALWSGFPILRLLGGRALDNLNTSRDGVDSRVKIPASAVEHDHAGRKHKVTQSKRQATNQCGVGFGSCASGVCCSLAGWCGTGDDYCRAPNCQIDFGPGCDALKTPTGASTLGVARPNLGSVPYGGIGIFNCIIPGTVALTFDDGPGIYTSTLLDILDFYNAKATFFITGINNGKGQIDDPSQPWFGLIQRMHASNHQIASHTWSHQDLSVITSQQRQDQMVKNEMALRNILGFFPTYMRPPYSSCNADCQSLLGTLGYHIINFNIDTQDYINNSPALIQNSKNIFNGAVAGSSPTSDSFLVIAHDIHEQTALNLTASMLGTLVAQGYTPVTVGDCLGDAAINWYRSDNGAGVVPVPTSSTSTTYPLATAAKIVSTDGTCGADANQFTCVGSNFGNCCSQYGWCGNTSDYCGVGCQDTGGAGSCS